MSSPDEAFFGLGGGDGTGGWRCEEKKNDTKRQNNLTTKWIVQLSLNKLLNPPIFVFCFFLKFKIVMNGKLCGCSLVYMSHSIEICTAINRNERTMDRLFGREKNEIRWTEKVTIDFNQIKFFLLTWREIYAYICRTMHLTLFFLSFFFLYLFIIS